MAVYALLPIQPMPRPSPLPCVGRPPACPMDPAVGPSLPCRCPTGYPRSPGAVAGGSTTVSSVLLPDGPGPAFGGWTGTLALVSAAVRASTKQSIHASCSGKNGGMSLLSSDAIEEHAFEKEMALQEKNASLSCCRRLLTVWLCPGYCPLAKRAMLLQSAIHVH